MAKNIQLDKYSNGTLAKYGLEAGFAAVIIMTIFILAMDVMMGLPADAFFTMIGLAMGVPMNQAPAVGGIIHIVMGTIFGAITGVVANSIPYFRNRFVGKGTSRAAVLGLLSGTVLFVIAFAPLLILLMPRAMMTLLGAMNPSASQNDISALAQSLLLLFLGGGVVLHWLYGGILGTVRGRLLPK